MEAAIKRHKPLGVWSIRLAAETLRLAEGFIQVKALGPVPVKGVAESVEVFELVGVTSFRRRLQATAARGLTHFVGRQLEMEALGQALTRAESGQGQVVAVVGEPGVGRYNGVSEPLPMVTVSLTPRHPPAMLNDPGPQALLQLILVNEAIQQQVNGAHVRNVYSFETDLSIERSPLGPAS